MGCGEGDHRKNPLADLPKPGHETKRDRVLTGRRVGCGVEGLRQYPCVFREHSPAAEFTGARLNEIGQLRWSEIHGDEIRLEGARTKTGEPTPYPYRLHALAILEGVKRIKDLPFVFSPNGNRPVAGWTPQKATIENLPASLRGSSTIYENGGNRPSETQDAAPGH